MKVKIICLFAIGILSLISVFFANQTPIDVKILDLYNISYAHAQSEDDNSCANYQAASVIRHCPNGTTCSCITCDSGNSTCTATCSCCSN